jgi:hypothetical protein
MLMARLSKPFTALRLDDPTPLADALAKIEGGLKGIADPAVDNHDDEDPGLLQMLRQLIYRADESTWDRALEIEIAFELGRRAAGDIAGIEAFRERLRRGGTIAGRVKKTEADRWRIDGHRIWLEKRGSLALGDRRRKSQEWVAELIQKRVTAVRAPSVRQIVETIRKWETDMRRSQASQPT